MARIGVQAMMLKSLFESDGVFDTLRQVREIGYRAVEVSQLAMTHDNVAALERARDELGIGIPSLSAAVSTPPGMPGDSLEDDFDKIVADARRLGSTMLRIGMLPFTAMASLEAVLAFCDQAGGYARRLRAEGLALAYHNHHIEFTRYDGSLLLDIIADRAPDLDLQLDVHWVHRGGFDPVRTIRRYGSRTTTVHLKDYRIGQVPPEAFGLLQQGDVSGFMTAFGAIVQFAEVGEGTLDFPAIIAEAEAHDVQFMFVEQDNLYGRTPLQALQTSHDNLVAMGFGDRF